MPGPSGVAHFNNPVNLATEGAVLNALPQPSAATSGTAGAVESAGHSAGSNGDTEKEELSGVGGVSLGGSLVAAKNNGGTVHVNGAVDENGKEKKKECKRKTKREQMKFDRDHGFTSIKRGLVNGHDEVRRAGRGEMPWSSRMRHGRGQDRRGWRI